MHFTLKSSIHNHLSSKTRKLSFPCRIFSSNLKERMAQRFYNLVLLPRVQDDIAEYKRLNFHLYSALKKALFKPGAWFKGKRKRNHWCFMNSKRRCSHRSDHLKFHSSINLWCQEILVIKTVLYSTLGGGEGAFGFLG